MSQAPVGKESLRPRGGAGRMTLRGPREGDHDAMLELFRRSFLVGYGRFLPFACVRYWICEDKGREYLGDHWRKFVLAERGAEGRLSGMIQFEDDHVLELWVEPDMQRQGVGGALLRHAETVMAGNGHVRARLNAFARNRRARAFYAAQGWEITGREISRVEPGVRLTVLTLEKQLVSDNIPTEKE